MERKRKYSGKVRLFGYCIVAFEIFAIIIWVLAAYGNSAVLVSLAQDSFNSASGNHGGFTNSSTGLTLSLPVTGSGFFAVTVSASVTIRNAQNQTVSQQQASVTVSPGGTQTLSLTIPESFIQSVQNSTYYAQINFEISSLSGLSGMGANVVVSSCVIRGGCSQ